MKRLILIYFTLFCYTFSTSAQYSKNIILDADTDNEVDDLFAISRALLESTWNITALNATQWQSSQWAAEQSMENGYRLNLALAALTEKKVLQRRGGEGRMYDWGDQARHSAAAYEIIKQAKQLPEGRQLTVVALGALTNVASAIFIDPSIESKLDLYWLGTSYDFEEQLLGITDFNCMMDIQALFIMLKSSVKMHIIPVSEANKFTFKYDETNAKLRGKHKLGDMLMDRWVNHSDGGKNERVLWDLALIEAMVHPEMATEVEVKLSPEFGGRTVGYYKNINAEAMQKDFFVVMNKFFAGR